MSISVIVCAYTEQRWDDLCAVVDALKTQTRAPDEIIVVIDHNRALFERAGSAINGVHIFENNQQRGLSGARNTGIAQATGEIVAFIDEDAIPTVDWLEKLMAHFTDESVYGVGGAIRPLWLSGRPGWFPSEFDWVVGCTYTGMPQTTQPVRNLIGCNMAFRRSVFNRVGGFVHGIGRVGTRPVGCEETELCIRVHQKLDHPKLIYDPAAVVDHRVPAVRARFRYFVDRCYSEGISKALVSQLVGRQDGLSSERSYMIRTLPQGVLNGLRDALRGDIGGLGRAGSIVLGLFTTGMGYLIGSVTLMQENRRVISSKPETFGS